MLLVTKLPQACLSFLYVFKERFCWLTNAEVGLAVRVKSFPRHGAELAFVLVGTGKILHRLRFLGLIGVAAGKRKHDRMKLAENFLFAHFGVDGEGEREIREEEKKLHFKFISKESMGSCSI